MAAHKFGSEVFTHPRKSLAVFFHVLVIVMGVLFVLPLSRRIKSGIFIFHPYFHFLKTSLTPIVCVRKDFFLKSRDGWERETYWLKLKLGSGNKWIDLSRI